MDSFDDFENDFDYDGESVDSDEPLEEPVEDPDPNATVEIDESRAHYADVVDGAPRVDVLGHQYKMMLPVIERTQYNDFLQRRPGDVPRLVVIDVANLMHGASNPTANSGLQARDDYKKVDAIYLLQMVRFFVKHDFECSLVTWHKYTMPKVIHNSFIVEEFLRMNMVMVVEKTQHDDMVMLDLAACADGVVLTKDRFRDWTERYRGVNTRYGQVIANQRIEPLYPGKKIQQEQQMQREGEGRDEGQWRRDRSDPSACSDWFEEKDKFSLSSNDGHLFVDFELRFMQPHLLHDKFFSREDTNPLHELVVESREMWDREGHKEKVLERIDDMAVRALRDLMGRRAAAQTGGGMQGWSTF